MKVASWRPAFVVAAAGGLLALLSVLLALWSKALVKDAQRVECDDRAADIVLGVRDALLERARRAEASVSGPGPMQADDVCASVAAVWRLAPDGAVAQGWGVEGKAGQAPPAPLVEAARRHRGADPLPIAISGAGAPLAATWLPRAGGAGALVLWDPDEVERRVIRPALGAVPRFQCALLRPTAEAPAKDDELGFRPKAFQAFDPPFSGWRVAVGLEDPDAVRRALRLQTLLLLLVPGWLLVALVAGVRAWSRREREAAARAAAREQLLARAYHELQTPLALLQAAAETIQAGAVERPDDLRRCADIVRRDTERLTRAVRRLLRWLRRDGLPGEPPAPVGPEVEAAADELRPGLAARGVALEVAVDPVAAARRAPAELVGDVARELLANVEKHAAGATKVRLALRPAGGDRVAVVVEDDGPGWPPAGEGAGEAPAPERGGFGLPLLREGLLLAGGGLALGPGLPRADGGRGAGATAEVACR